MVDYPVTVTASYDATSAPNGLLGRLRVWAAASDGRTFTVDASIPPVRWTASAEYLLAAPTAQDAEREAVGRYLAESARVGITVPQTVLGATSPRG